MPYALASQAGTSALLRRERAPLGTASRRGGHERSLTPTSTIAQSLAASESSGMEPVMRAESLTFLSLLVSLTGAVQGCGAESAGTPVSDDGGSPPRELGPWHEPETVARR
jgi:hypothetical protein